MDRSKLKASVEDGTLKTMLNRLGYDLVRLRVPRSSKKPVSLREMRDRARKKQ